MTNELKPNAKPCIDYFDDELRVDDGSADGSKVFHVGKHYRKGVDYHEQRKEFWLDLAKREALSGNSEVIESILGWAEKHANLAAGRTSASVFASPTSTILTKAAADEIRNMVTAENKTDFNRKQLTHMINQAKSHAHMGDRDGMEHALSEAKELAESVGLYNDDLGLELKDIPSLVNEEKELEIAIRGTSRMFEHAAAAARMGFVDVMENTLSFAEKNAALASIDIEEKVRNLIATLTPEQQKEFKKVHDEQFKAKVATNDKNAVADKAETKATENANETTVADDKYEAKVADDEVRMAVDSKREDKITKDVEMQVAEDETLLGNDKPTAELSDDDERTAVNNKTKDKKDINNDKTKEPNPDDNDEATKKTGDYDMTIADDKTHDMIVSTTDDEMTGACCKPEVKNVEEDKEMTAADDEKEAKVAENSNGDLIVDP